MIAFWRLKASTFLKRLLDFAKDGFNLSAE